MKKALSKTQKEGGLKAGELRNIHLNGREVTYILMRCRRRTIGMRIDRSGLTVRIPVRETLQWVESVLEKRADWIVTKLNEWKNRKPSGPAWEEGSIFLLLGAPWRVTVTTAGTVCMVPLDIGAGVEETQFRLPLPSLLTAQQIERAVMDWYHHHALECFSRRMTLYAQKLGVALPQLRLSHARTLWGSCHSRGVVRLNWRLIQKPLDLVDYVVAHELSHLIEMNHSPAFWQTVESIYPDYKAARKRLRMLG
ncbi:SprT family zinc-dependent metalloprotease [Nitrosospira sp. Is2]|uniref:M48 family metallopeptidase n=1 Tax=Nitrosospira sp. Is2 TaxID=3080532 RepID=UPI00295397B6|nr:SprT family zinc-dependent metalloprotease [Nitrosospira sp. Is2]WON74840.1 SprT family zinc-dependent metalloprotease [Nitrosospira sp. Is2]